METCPGDEQLVELAEGKVDERTRTRLEHHIDVCEICRAALGAILAGGAPVWTLGRYQIEGVLGSGGMGIVYRGWDPALSRAVAVKVVRTGDDDGVLRTRLAREAQSLARLNHPNVCQVYDVGTDGNELWIAMELIEGTTLRGWLAGKPARAEVIAVLVAAGRGLAAAHGAGLVHRDVKPENVLVDKRGRAVVTDFGLARPEDPDAGTKTSVLAGTPAYMAPEQLDATPADARSDQYAFAVMAHEALIGARPRPRNVASASLPPALRSVLARALSDDPAHRFPTLAALLDALVRATEPRPRWPLALAALGSVAVVGVVAFGLTRGGSREVSVPDAAVVALAAPDAAAPDAAVADAHALAPSDAAHRIIVKAPADAGVRPRDAAAVAVAAPPRDAAVQVLSPETAADREAPRFGSTKSVKNVRPARTTTLAEAEKIFASGACAMPGVAKANTWTQPVEWGKVLRVADAVILEAANPKRDYWVPMDARLYEIQGPHRKYTINGYTGGAVHGELGAKPGDLVAYCAQHDDDGVKLPGDWHGPITWMHVTVRVGGPPDYGKLKLITYSEIDGTAKDQTWPFADRVLVYDGTGGRLNNGRYMMSGWELEIDSDTKNAFEPHRGAWIVVEKPRWEPYVKDRSITVLHAAEMREHVFPAP